MMPKKMGMDKNRNKIHLNHNLLIFFLLLTFLKVEYLN
jgi:hypothetical protein